MNLFFYLTLLLAPILTYSNSIDPFSLKTLLVMIFGVLCLLDYRQPRKSYRPDVAYLFFGWCFLTYIFCPWKFGNPGIESLLMIAYLGIYVYARDHVFTEKVVPVILISAVLTLAYNFWQTGIHFTRLEIGPSFVNANIYAGWLVLVLPVALAWAFTGKWIKRVLGGLIFCFGLLALWNTGCRSAMLGMTAALAAFSAFYWGKRGVAIAALIIGLFGAIWWWMFPHQIIDPSRAHFWRGTLDLMASKPWTGYGIGSYRTIYPFFKENISAGADPSHLLEHCHNWGFEMISEIGIIGLLLFLFMLWKIFKNIYWGEPYAWLSQKQKDLNLYHLAMMFGLFGSLIDGFYNVALQYSAVGMIFWVYLGLLASNAKREETKHEGWLAGFSRWSDYCFFN